MVMVSLRSRVRAVLAGAILLMSSAGACGHPDGTDPDDGRPGMAEGRSDPPSLAGLPATWWRPADVLAVDDALYLGDRWALLDGARRRVHLVDTLGRTIRSVGGGGDGPGEFRGPLQVLGDSEGFAVLSAGGRLDRFDTGGHFLGREALDLGACPLANVREAATRDGRRYLAAICTRGRVRAFALLAADPDERARVLLERTVPGGDDLGLEVPALAMMEDGIAFGAGDDPCASLVPTSGTGPGGTRCLAGDPIPLPEIVRRELDRSLGSRARAVGMDLVVPERFPWLDLLLAGANGTLIARRPVSATGWLLERLGAPGGRWAVPSGVDVLGSQGRILLVHTGPEGVALAVLLSDVLPWEGGTSGSPP